MKGVAWLIGRILGLGGVRDVSGWDGMCQVGTGSDRTSRGGFNVHERLCGVLSHIIMHLAI